MHFILYLTLYDHFESIIARFTILILFTFETLQLYNHNLSLYQTFHCQS